MIEFENVSFSYEGQEHGGLHGISLKIADGECVLFCGRSGCGKTTVTRLVNGLIPQFYQGEIQGRVLVDGQEISNLPMYQIAAKVGSVFQNPRTQFFNVDTDSEIAFGIENEARPVKELEERVEQTTKDLHIEKLRNRNIFELSGGEKQKIAFASVYAMNPEIYLLDEPSSNLDMASIQELKEHLRLIKSQGKTILIAEHRLYYLRGLADRFIYLAEGQVSRDYSAAEFEQLTEQQRSNMGLRTFALERLLPPVLPQQEKTALALHNFRIAYKKEPETLHIMDCEIPTNRIVGIIGNNGAGKSTFSRCFCGLEKRCGEIVWNGKKYRPKDRLNTCYMVMQEVNHQLFTESVLDEVLISMEEENQERAEEILNRLDLLAFKDRHPMSLSGGQKQRVAIARALANRPPIILADEPTAALDEENRDLLLQIMQKQMEGKGILFVSHDVAALKNLCQNVYVLGAGKIIEHGTMDKLLSSPQTDWMKQFSALSHRESRGEWKWEKL